MGIAIKYPKRLIEVDLPISYLSKNAAAEMEKRRGHIPMMHIWWAHRPPVACRSILLTSLLPDPTDQKCPKSFLKLAKPIIQKYRSHFGKKGVNLENLTEIRDALFDIVRDVSIFEMRTDHLLIESCRKLVSSASQGHELLICDPFSGGGIIPYEGLD